MKENLAAGTLNIESYGFNLFSFSVEAKEALLHVLSPSLGVTKFPKSCK